MPNKKIKMRLENDLVKSIKKGNEKSFELIFRTYFLKLCTYALSYTKQLETAEDLVKDVFVNLWNNRKQLEIHSSLSGYLYHAVRNSCINHLKRDKNKKNLSIEELRYLELKIKEPLSNDYLIENIFTSELEDKINLQIKKLPKTCRQIFELSRFEGLSHKKIAEKLNISENTVKVQIYRALKRMRDVLYFIFILLDILF